jgi:hypothetical protein
MQLNSNRAMVIVPLVVLLGTVAMAQNNGKSSISELEQQLSKMKRERSLPAGFTVSARNGTTGQALTASFNAGPSAKRAFPAAFKQIAPYFDQVPALQSAFGDAQDRQIQGFFRGVYQNAPVRGLMVVSVQNGTGHTAALFDREDLFRNSLPVLAKQMTASLPAPPPGSVAAPQAALELIRTPFPDGTGAISLPASWKLIDTYKGSCDVSGPDGAFLSLGIFQTVLPTQPTAGMMFGPYRQPWPAFVQYADMNNKMALSQRRASIRLVEQTPDQYPGGEAAWFSYEFVMDGKTTRGLVWGASAPIAGGWFHYHSMAAAPAAVYAKDLPTMVAIWKSWGVSQAVFRERMDAALKSMRETYQIMQATHDNQVRAYDNVNYAWGEILRGVTMIENVATGGRTEVNSNDAQGIVNSLNQQGYNIQVVPLNQLVP